MAEFDAKAFTKAEFEPRTEAVPVDGLRSFFPDLGEDETPEWTVRGLTHAELARAEDASRRRQDLAAVVDALNGDEGKKQEAIKELLGVDQHVPQDTAKRMEMLVRGSVDPEIDLEVAVKLATAFPIEFSALTNKVIELTGRGHEALKKPAPSGGSKKSKTASASAT